MFSYDQIEGLQAMLAGPQEEEDGHVYGSALNPSSLHGKGKKEIAKPNSKVEVKTFNRGINGGATEEALAL